METRATNRREFLRWTTAAAVAGTGLGALSASAAESRKRQFTMDLVCGAIGVRADQPEAIRLAEKHGFESLAPSPHFLAGLSDEELAKLRADMTAKSLVWGSAGLPVDFRGDEGKFRAGLESLPKLAAALNRAGASRMNTWLSPRHDTRTYMDNFRLHADRLRKIATILADHGQRLGLEYVGTKTLWTNGRYPFIHTMAETKDLIAEIACDNVGFVLDSWHWYTAGEGEADLLSLENRDVVACDLNDAPRGVPVDEQLDNRRELPAATGIIDPKTFLGALVKIGYDGPVRAEPFNGRLNAMENEPAVAATAAALRKAFALVE